MENLLLLDKIASCFGLKVLIKFIASGAISLISFLFHGVNL